MPLTGSTGFVGRHLVETAAPSAGIRACALLVTREVARDCGFGAAETVIGSLEDEAALKQLVSGAAAVIHLAGAIAARDRAGFFAINAAGTRALAEAAAQAAGVRRFIHVSSLAAREPQLSDYGASKRAGEDALFGLEAAWGC